ncbi:MAG: TolC family protein [Bryobacteraceae bacterium]
MVTRSILALAVAVSAAAPAQPRKLTLAEAEEIALHNHPRVSSALLIAEAAKLGVTEARAPLYPQAFGVLTGVAAEHGSTLAAGTVQTSSLYSRVAAGVGVTQLITDFGRTGNLVASAKARAAAQDQKAVNVRAAIRIVVDQAYYQALAANAILKVAQAVSANRALLLRQVRALAQSSLKSTLDVSFAEVVASEAELGLVRAENDARAAQAHLSAALGSEQSEVFELTDEPLPAPLDPDPEPLRTRAMQQRPDLAALEASQEAARRFAQAERDLSRPTVGLMGVAGALPDTDPRLKGTYSAAGFNVTIPILNGRLYSARRTEAELRAQAAEKDVLDLAVRVSEQVRMAWLEADTAFRRIDVTARLVAEAQQALRLARTRYDIGLGSIVEVNQAQLSEVSAEIAAAGANYDYLSRRAALAFVTGDLR